MNGDQVRIAVSRYILWNLAGKIGKQGELIHNSCTLARIPTGSHPKHVN